MLIQPGDLGAHQIDPVSLRRRAIGRLTVTSCHGNTVSAPEPPLRRSDEAPGLQVTRLTPSTVGGMSHLSDSSVQREAEAFILDAVATRLGMTLRGDSRIEVGGGAHVEVDGQSVDGSVIVEAYARHGTLKGAQLKKVAQDVLKFALLRRTDGWGTARMILAFASTEAKDSIRGWVAQAVLAFEVELLVVEVPADVTQRILAAQRRQVMVNLSADEAESLTDPP
jgi:hypothetical protein